MMSLKDIGAKLPPGFRFHPSDEELVCHYLRNKVRAKFNHHDHLHHHHHHLDDHHLDHDHLKGFNTDLVEIDLHTCEPWQLPDVAKLNAKEWYFFSFRDRKYSTGYRTNRATTCGYWKATGKDRTVVDPHSKSTVGMRKTLVFYRNRAPNGMKTSWIMHEFRLECPNTLPQEDWVLCRVFNKCKESSFLSSDPTTYLATPSSNIDHNHHDKLPCTMPSSSPPSTIIINHHAQQQHDHHIPCGWEQIMAPESLLNLVYDNGAAMNVASTKGNMFFENTCIGSSDISLTNEIDSTTIAFQ